MSQCRGLSIGQWSPMYSVLFQLLLARLLDTNIRQVFKCAILFYNYFHFSC